MAFSLLIYGAELFGFMTALLHIFMTWRLKCRVSPPVPEGLRVAVFIPTFDESEDLVRNTLIAALHMDYPHETWLLDDGNRPSMRAQAEELGVRYLARSDNTHAKAGNLNHALAHTDADFIAVFDADHAPQRHFLERTLGYLAADDKVAFVQTPQDFF
ncbi:MAG: glycosyltransferase, partial [Gammaproteobacteria bacterium]|nr:glycosyltransferase [Gammaproteobacteria bacterium]